MLHMMWSQASGAPSGGHGLFHRYHIEALTLEGVRFKKGFRNHPLEKIARLAPMNRLCKGRVHWKKKQHQLST